MAGMVADELMVKRTTWLYACAAGSVLQLCIEIGTKWRDKQVGVD